MTSKKILSPAQAQRVCQKLSKQGKKIVFTNGCFDILHSGHVRYLEAAKKKGHFLVVALDTDAAVRKLKGPERPVNGLADRMQVMAALQCVDIVTWFERANPVPLIKKLKPKILVKGGDWKVHQILGSTEVISWGGRAFSLPYIPGRSTTRIIEKIKRKR